MGEVAAHGPPVPHERVGEHAPRVREHGIARLDQLRSLELGLAGHGADHEHATLFLEVRKILDAVDVH